MELKYETVEFHIETTKKNKAGRSQRTKKFKEEITQQRRQGLIKKKSRCRSTKKKKADQKQQTQTLIETMNPDLPNYPQTQIALSSAHEQRRL